MELIALQYGKTTLPEDWIRTDGDGARAYPIALLFFLIRTDSKRILVDVGCDTMPGFELLEHESPVLTLERLGVRREKITDIVLTHGHHDHADALRYYPNAAVYVHERERASVASYLLPQQSVVAFSAPFALCDGVRVVPICGHTDGSSVVELTGKSRITVLCGDECYHRSCFSFPERSGGSRNRANTLAFFERYSAPDYQTILFHDPDLVGKVGAQQLQLL
ncbi:MAG: MBL fold metallo-hydrolase [Clostridia bacterium]|nr:MBL fold metallo-hydrolase [Clostridia bacterium]